MNEPIEERKIMELQIETERLAFLDSIIASMTPHQLKLAHKYLEDQIKAAIQLLKRKLPKLELIVKPENPPKVRCVICPASVMKDEYGRTSAGISCLITNQIGILNHFMLAPKEVIQAVVIHELLHQLYPFATDQSKNFLLVRDSIRYAYPEWAQLEEEWVVRAEERIVGNLDLLDAWYFAIEIGGNNWRPLYYAAKKRLRKIGAAQDVSSSPRLDPEFLNS